MDESYGQYPNVDITDFMNEYLKLKRKLKKRVETKSKRATIISHDDIMNLNITLNNCNSIDDVINSI